MDIAPDGRASVTLANGSTQKILYSSSLVTGNWHHITATFAQPELKIYVDGQLEGTTTYNLPLQHNAQADVLLGCVDHSYYPMSHFLDGLMDDVRIYNRALSASEIEELAISPFYYVDASRPDDSGDGRSWATAKQTIQAAIDLTVDDDTVWVTNGTYNTGSTLTPKGTLLNRVVATNAIVIRSVTGPESTIIQGQGPIGTNAVRGAYLSGGAQLIGFTIEDGATHRIYDQLNGKGGGIYGTGCSVSNCVIKNNAAEGEAGGIYVGSDMSLVCNSLIENNWAGHLGGGAALQGDGTIVMRNCRITKNKSALHGGGVFMYHSGTMENCLVAENAATNSAGGIWVDGGSLGVYINNCTITGNSAPDNGGLDYIASGATVINSIVWGNTNGNWHGGSYAYCATTPLPSGTGNLSDDPLFADAEFHLSAGSPAINAGNNGDVFTATDLDNNPRIVGGVVDMGSYERQDAGIDADDDGISDLWELNQFGGRHFARPDTVCSNGVNTLLQAYIIGLNPNDPQARFETSSFYPSTQNGNILQWPCVSGRVYSVYFSTNLMSGFQPLATNIQWTAGCFTDSVHNADSQIFYKIEVKLDE